MRSSSFQTAQQLGINDSKNKSGQDERAGATPSKKSFESERRCAMPPECAYKYTAHEQSAF